MKEIANQDRGTLSRADSASPGSVSSLGAARISRLTVAGTFEVTRAAVDRDLYHRTPEELATDSFKHDLVRNHREFTRIDCSAYGGSLLTDGTQDTYIFNLIATVPPGQTQRDIDAWWHYQGPMETRQARVIGVS